MRKKSEKDKLKAFNAAKKLASCTSYLWGLITPLIVIVFMMILVGPPLIANYMSTLVASGDWTHHEEPIDDMKDFKRFGINIDEIKKPVF